MLDDNEVPIYC